MFEGVRKTRKIRESAPASSTATELSTRSRRQTIRLSAFECVEACSLLANDEPAYARFVTDRQVARVRATGIPNVVAALVAQARRGTAEKAILEGFAKMFLPQSFEIDKPLKVARFVVDRVWTEHDAVEVTEWSRDLELFGRGMLPEGKRRGF